MLTQRASARLLIALAYTSATLFRTPAYGESREDDLKSEIAALKADNAAVREQLRKLEEQQNTLLELVEGLRQRPDALPIASGQRPVAAPNNVLAAEPPMPSTAAATAASAPEPTNPAPQAERTDDDRYQDGIVIWQTDDEATVPFLMKFNLNTQVRYLNTTGSEDTFTDHLGVVREVNTRNDITVNRSMFWVATSSISGCVIAAPCGRRPALRLSS